MKHLLLLAGILFAVTNLLSAQATSYPRGGYRTFEEFKTKKPSIPFDFEITKRTVKDIKMNGGVDYKVTSKSLSKDIVKKEIYAVSTGDTLYMNCYVQSVQYWYAKVIEEGKYIAFEGGVFIYGQEASHPSAFGGVGTGVEGANAAMVRYLYFMDVKAGKLKPLSGKEMYPIINPFPELKEQYNKEPDRDNREVLLKYLHLINVNAK